MHQPYDDDEAPQYDDEAPQYDDGPDYKDKESLAPSDYPRPGEKGFFAHHTALAWALVQEGFVDFACTESASRIETKNELGHKVILNYHFEMNERGKENYRRAMGDE
jgi:hypothetical protein